MMSAPPTHAEEKAQSAGLSGKQNPRNRQHDASKHLTQALARGRWRRDVRVCDRKIDSQSLEAGIQCRVREG